MGILRVDKLSGLETPTSITSSVYFDGDARNDNLNFAGDPPDLDFQNTDFTFESWVYPTDMSSDRYWCSKGDGNLPGTAMDVRFDSDGQIRISFYVSSTAYTLNTDPGVLQENVWSHVAVVRSGTSFKSYVNGIETSSATHDITISDVSATFKIGILEGVGTGFKGYMSDFRFVRGKAVYTEEFTPPVYALEPIDGTVLLCCNNPDSVAAVSLAGIGTSKTITVNGDVSIASTNPGSLKDFTYGTEFNGVTTFDTQGYFVPPSGTTTQRGRGHAVFGGGENPSKVNVIYSINISSSGIAGNFGDLTIARKELGGCASSTRGVFAGGSSTGESPAPPFSRSNVIDYVTLATEGNAVDFGDLTGNHDMMHCGLSNSTRGIFAGGEMPSAPSGTNTIQYVTIAALGAAQDFGDLLRNTKESAGCASPTRGIIFGDGLGEIQYITISTLGNAIDFGDQTFTNDLAASCSDSTRGMIGGGTSLITGGTINTIQYVTITTLGNAQDFGDLTHARSELSAVSNSIRGVFAGGSSEGNRIDYITIQTTGNAQDFGDLPTSGNSQEQGSASDSHGGIS